MEKKNNALVRMKMQIAKAWAMAEDWCKASAPRGPERWVLAITPAGFHYVDGDYAYTYAHFISWEEAAAGLEMAKKRGRI